MKTHSQLYLFWLKFKQQKLALYSFYFILFLVFVAILAPILAPFDPINDLNYELINGKPTLKHWFGLDSLGRDIFSRILYGARLSLFTGFFSVFIGAIIGTFVGLFAGFYGGWIDRLSMRICDILFAFPGILLAIAVVAYLGNGLMNVIIAVAVFSIPAFARLIRGNVLAMKNLTYIDAERSIGASKKYILFKHIFLGTVSPALVYFTLRIGTSIITAAGLSFIGLGAQPPAPEWGAMLNAARSDLLTAPHSIIFPCLVIFLTVLAFNLLGDGLRDALDPKSNL